MNFAHSECIKATAVVEYSYLLIYSYQYLLTVLSGTLQGLHLHDVLTALQ